MKNAGKIMKWGYMLLIIGFGFMILETIVFQFIYGWHWTAIGPWEKRADKVSELIINVGLVCVWVVVLRVVLFVIDMYDEIMEYLDKVTGTKEEIKND